MSKRLSWFLLAASVALNLFFLAGLVYPQLIGKPASMMTEDPVAAAAKDFGLDARQVAGLEALRQSIAERRAAAGGGSSGFRTLMIEALQAPVFDRASLETRLNERRQERDGMVLDMMEELHGYLAGLSPDQKAAFLERSRERGFLRALLWPQPERR
ncbi:periplasmic heavy metal sensor [Pelagibius litoralis]|uniref:Periplasmic heavy metal sensor n=1 Tax=Pelagibius litoralis TaxID=374515 RepID=A0A967F232_9PROT|nr:periplasmic heavy metal sensor [Pelagibius litoralis]NIA71567.1 periplasmic heavy metal sensor [Pelagibius litoralis]